MRVGGWVCMYVMHCIICFGVQSQNTETSYLRSFGMMSCLTGLALHCFAAAKQAVN